MPVVHKRGSGKNNQSSIGQYLNPHAGIREKMASKGIQPRNHMRDNFRELREVQERNREQREMSRQPDKEMYKLSQFKDVESRLYNSNQRQQQQPATNHDYLSRGKSEQRRCDMAEQGRIARREIENKMKEAQFYSTAPVSPRKATVPKSNEHGHISRHDIDFIQKNKVKAIAALPKGMSSPRRDVEAKHKAYGKVPEYLEDRKMRWAEEEAERRRRMPDPNCPPGMTLMPEDERLETLDTLVASKKEALRQLGQLPFNTETPSLRRKKEALEHKLKEVENAISIFSKSKVFVAL